MQIRSGELLALTTDGEIGVTRFSYVYRSQKNNISIINIGKTVGEIPSIEPRISILDGEIVPAKELQIRFSNTVYSATSISSDAMPSEFLPKYSLIRQL